MAMYKETAYGLAALKGETEKIRATTEGNRNCQLVKSSFKMGQLIASSIIEPEYVEQELWAAAVQTGLGMKEAEKTIRRGLQAGLQHPRVPKECSISSILPINKPITERTIKDNSYIGKEIIIEHRMLTSGPLPIEQRHALVYIRRAVVYGSPKVIDGYTCIVQTDIVARSGLTRYQVGHCLRIFTRFGLLEVMPDPPLYKNGRKSTYIRLAECVLTGDMQAIEDLINQVKNCE